MTPKLDRTHKLERELHLRQQQVRRLLQITQAINNNVTVEDLFGMYRAFLQEELVVKEMALFVRNSGDDSQWMLATQIGIDNVQFLDIDLGSVLEKFVRPGMLEGPLPTFFKPFLHVVPVLHKERPIAYIFIGDFEDDDDMYERIQIITTITNVIAVAIENKRLFRRQLAQDRLEADMDLGAKVQKMLIPERFPVRDEYEIDTIYKPKLGVGGDYIDFKEFDDGKLVFCIGDFAGKGVSAALLMANFQANFHTLIKKRTDLKKFVREINDAVYQITQGERFVTFFVGEYDRKKHQLRYINAGHPPPILIHDQGIKLLTEGTLVLGSIDELPMLDVGTVDLPSQALICTFTDGLTDLQNPAGEVLDEDILYNWARRQHGRSAASFNRSLQVFLDEFRQYNDYPDDLTVLTCRIFKIQDGDY